MPEAVPIFIPRDSVNDDTVQILAWKFPSGSMVENGQLICEVETSKAVMEIHAPNSGVLLYTAAEGDEVPVGANICTISAIAAKISDSRSPLPDSEVPSPTLPVEAASEIRSTAGARAAAAELGVDLSSFPPGSLVRREDVLRKVGKPAASDIRPPHRGPATASPVRWEDLPRRKALEGRILRDGRTSTVQSSITSICQVSGLLLRLEKLGLSMVALQAAIIYEAARLLRKYPVLNSVYDNGRIGIYDEVHVGWALDGGTGLIVPVIPDADRKGLLEIAAVMDRQLEAYLDNALTPTDLSPVTFTVTDLSGYGVSFFEPLIAAGQAAILGIGKGPDSEGQATLYLTLAFDHQITEGRKAAGFLQDLRGRLEAHALPAQVKAPELDSVEPAPYCVVCHRDRETLQRLKLVLLKSEIPAGYVCSLCVAGW